MNLLLSLSAAAVASLSGNNIGTAFAFRAGAPSIEIKYYRGAASWRPHHHCRRSTTRLLSSPNDEEFNYNNSQEQEMMDQAMMAEQFRQVEGSQQMPPPGAPQQRLDPLIASLTRIDEPTPDNVPTVQAPLIGEIPADGNLALLVPAAAISVLGFIFSIVVAFNSRDAIVSEVSKVELPKMEYTPTKVDPEKCRGLCSSQEEDLDGLRNFMESLRRDN
jgi:hypothetical protein